MQDKNGSDSAYLVPGTRYRINAEGRIPSTEDRAGKRAHRVCILDPASIRALRAIHPSFTLLRHFITSSLHYSVTPSPRHFVPALPCTFLDPLPRGQLQFFALSGRVGGTWGPSGSSLDSGWTPTRPGLAQRLQGAKVTSNG